MQLPEKYRPKTWAEFVGQAKIVMQVRRMMGRSDFGAESGEAFYLVGPTGTGKTSLCGLMARELGVAQGAWNYVEIDGDKCSVDQVRQLDERTQAACLFADSWQVFIVNEASALKERAIEAWLTLLERLPAKWLVIFTTHVKTSPDLFGEYTKPFMDRCCVFRFTNQCLAENMAARAREIAVAENLNGKPEHAYLRLVQDCQNSMREALQRIGQGEMMTESVGAI